METTRLSLNQATVRPLTLAETLSLCVRHEIPAVGLWRESVAEAGLAAAAAAVRRSGRHVSSLCRGGFFTHADPAARRAAHADNLAAIEEASVLEADVLVLVSGGLVPGSRDLGVARRMIADSIADLVPRARELGVLLGIESLHPMFCADRCVLSRLGDAVDLALTFPADVVGVVVDTYNIWWDSQAGADIARAAGRIAGYQLGDWVLPLPPDMLLGRGHIGDGSIDFSLISQHVLASGYDGFTEVEIFNQQVWDAPPDDTAATVKQRFAEMLGSVPWHRAAGAGSSAVSSSVAARPPRSTASARAGRVGAVPVGHVRTGAGGSGGIGGSRGSGDRMTSSMIDFTAAAPVPVNLDVRWIHGSRSAKRDTGPKIQVHACDPHTFVLRQSKAINYEAPFLYLLFGNDRALLLDTGATEQADAFPLRETVDTIMENWLAGNPRSSYELVVAHTHGHHDHIAADSQFAGRPDTIMVPGDVPSVQSYFQITDWPGQVVQLDLGGRVLDVTGIPGHHVASIVVYDPWTGFLVTGDTVYPGRLFARDMPVFAVSMDRLVEFAAARQVSHVMGCHIEMTRTPGKDYPIGALYQPDEPPLQMTVEQLAAVRDATASVAGRPGAHVFDDFIIFNGPCTLPVARQAARLLWGKVRKPAAAQPAR